MTDTRNRPSNRRPVMAAIFCVCLVSGFAIWSLASSRTPPRALLPKPPIAVQHTAEGPRLHLSDRDDRVVPLPNGERRMVSSVLNITSPMHYGKFVWDETGVPEGDVWVRVDLEGQTMSVFRGEHEIGAGVILFGADSHPTPIGRFPVMAKFKDHQSSIYDAEMPYTLRLTGDGVAIHGSNVRRGLATHGCIGIPRAFAAKVFEAVKVADPVYIVPVAKALPKV